MEFEEFEGAQVCSSLTLRSYFEMSLVQAAMGVHIICGKSLETKAYSSQGGARTG